MTKEQIIDFEKRVADAFLEGKIRAPIHLSDGNEEQLIEIFKNVKKTDWVCSSWRSHSHALLHGIPEEMIMNKILEGHSITMMFPEYKFFTSAIVGGICPIATGLALGIKKNGGNDHVWCFVGDMTAETGDFYESVKYSQNFDLPITFVIEDNTQSVGTPTSVVWGKGEVEPYFEMPKQVDNKVIKYGYIKTLPHVGIGKFVTF